MFINSFINDPFRSLTASRPRKRAPRATGNGPDALDPRFRGGDDQRQKDSRGRVSVAALLELDVETKRTKLFDQHVERFGDAGLKIVIASDNRLVDFGPAGYVVRLDRQHLLQRVGRAIGFQRPNFHLPETLTAELGLAAERLLGDEAVGAN